MIQNEELIWMKRLHQLRIITYGKLVPISKEKKSIGVKWIYKEKKRKSIGVKWIYKKKKKMSKEKKRGTRRDWKKKTIVKNKELITMKFLL